MIMFQKKKIKYLYPTDCTKADINSVNYTLTFFGMLYWLEISLSAQSLLLERFATFLHFLYIFYIYMDASD